jgi:hypothetical protein
MLDIAPFSGAFGFTQLQKERVANAPQVHTPSTRYKSLPGRKPANFRGDLRL